MIQTTSRPDIRRTAYNPLPRPGSERFFKPRKLKTAGKPLRLGKTPLPILKSIKTLTNNVEEGLSNKLVFE